MLDEKRPESGGAMNLQETGDGPPAEMAEPEAPDALTEDQVQEAKNEAAELISRLQDVSGSKELELLDGITNVGVQAQRDAAERLDLLRTRIGTFINEGGTSESIANGLRDLRLTLNRINPDELTDPGVGQRVIEVLPFFGGRGNSMVRAINKMALRYEPVSHQVAEIEVKLRDGRASLVRDNIELRKMYEDVEAQRLPIKRNAYVGEMLAYRLSQMLEETEDPTKREKIQEALHDVLVRVADLRTMEEVHLQFFVSVDMSRSNNNRLAQAVDRTLTMTANVVTVGLAIQTALIRQKRVMEAAQRTRDFLGDLVVANATAIKRHTQEVGDLYNNPVIAIEKVSEAHDELIEALDLASTLRQEGIEAARRNTAELSRRAADLERRLEGAITDTAAIPRTTETQMEGHQVPKEVSHGNP